MSTPSIGAYFSNDGDDQAQAAVAVVMPTVIRAELIEAVQSVFDQDFPGKIQILIGVDKAIDSLDDLYALLERRPPNISCLVLNLPYSTSRRHGGPHNPVDGGSLRAVLSLMANARHVAYLDDDNTWRRGHLSGLIAAVEGKAWAYSYRMLIDQVSRQEISVDRWDSVGPGRGRFRDVGGFVDTNCIIVDKVSAVQLLARWATTPDGAMASTADRNFYRSICGLPHGVVSAVTVNYLVRPSNLIMGFVGKTMSFEEQLDLAV